MAAGAAYCGSPLRNSISLSFEVISRWVYVCTVLIANNVLAPHFRLSDANGPTIAQPSRHENDPTSLLKGSNRSLNPPNGEFQTFKPVSRAVLPRPRSFSAPSGLFMFISSHICQQRSPVLVHELFVKVDNPSYPFCPRRQERRPEMIRTIPLTEARAWYNTYPSAIQ